MNVRVVEGDTGRVSGARAGGEQDHPGGQDPFAAVRQPDPDPPAGGERAVPMDQLDAVAFDIGPDSLGGDGDDFRRPAGQASSVTAGSRLRLRP